MAEKQLNARIQMRRDTAANWTSTNPVLKKGELVIVDTSNGEIRFKVGNGENTFTGLPYQDEILRGMIPDEKADLGIFVQEAEPTNSTEGAIWIDTSESAEGIIPAEEVEF